MAVHSWSLIELDDDGTTTRTRPLSIEGVFLELHVPNENADQNGIVTESMQVLFEAYGGDTAQEISRDVRTYLTEARKRRRRVYLLFSTLEESTTWRSPLVGGQIEWDQDALKGFGSGFLRATIIINRENFFERHDAEVKIGDGSMVNNGASRLALTAPGGDIDAPLRVEITNTYGTIDTQKIYMAVNADADPGTGLLYLAGGSDTWSTAQTGDRPNPNLLVTFDDTQLETLRGDQYHILVGLSSTTGDFTMQAAIYTVVGAQEREVVWTDEFTVSTEEIIDLGALPIPPVGSGYGFGDMALGLVVRDKNGSTSGSFAADWIKLLPSPVRVFTQTGYNSAVNDVWVDDGINELTYIYDASTAVRMTYCYADGPVLTAPAHKASELLLAMDEYTGGVKDDTTVDVEVYVRPRRVTL